MKRLFLAALLIACSLAVVSTAGSQGHADAGRVVSALGVAAVEGRPVAVEVFVAVPPGRDAAAEARAAVVELGGRPVDPAEFSTSGLVWDQFLDGDAGNNFLVQNYNPSTEPTGSALTALQNSEATWTNVPSSSFTFQYGGTTTRCPSLVKQCPGAQYFDAFNDVGWLDLGRCVARCTLGVTWYSTSGTDEADLALNIRARWRTDGQNYDVETVLLHENGHVAGLGHSDVTAAVMYAYYQGTRRALHADDVSGISTLYP